MKFTKINPSVQKIVQDLLAHYPLVKKIVRDIVTQHGQVLLVGGAVRDILMGIPVKDLDIEVHGVSIEQLQKILEKYSPVSLVGKSFGVLRLHGLDIDWSLPRTDSAGRKPEVIIDPDMSIQDAFKRRDLTINAMAIDLHTYELIDPFHGLQDSKQGILRAPDAALFIEDPLRFFRVMQFIGRFEMNPDDTLDKICASMSLQGISTERIESEFDKLLLKSKRPSLGIRWLKKIGRLQEILPELAATIDVPQEPSWHPEGDVFEHSMQALDAAALLQYEDTHQKLIVLYAALCHDLGKAVTTKQIDGKWRSLGHEIAGVELAQTMMRRLTRRHELIKAVTKLVRNHMYPIQFIAQGAKPPAYKRLALKLTPEVSMVVLAHVALADQQGRNPQGPLPLQKEVPAITEFLKKAEQMRISYKPEEALVQGKDLMGFVSPGPEMGKLVKKAYEIQIEEGIQDKQELIQRILKK